MEKVCTRFSPSPTGNMHIGNLRIALYAYLYAKQNNGKFILRIEDTNKNFSKLDLDTNISYIKSTLKQFNLNWDEYYRQSERLSIYQYYAHKLVNEGMAYICQCPENSIEPCKCKLTNNPYVNKNYCIKFRVNSDISYNIDCKDELRGNISCNSNNLKDIVILKQNGYPTYHLASVIDDFLMGITDVFRGEEWLNFFPYHILLYNALGFSIPKYYHLPLILNENSKKLSKRNNDIDITSIMLSGILPSVILNYTLMLGYKFVETETITTIGEMIKIFNVHNINLSPSRFDKKKLKNMNLKYAKTKEGIREYFELYKNKFKHERLERLLYAYQNGINIVDLYNKTLNAPRINSIKDLDIRYKKFFKYLYQQLEYIKKHKYNNDGRNFLDISEAKNILQKFLNIGYTNKEIHEWIRKALTGEIKGLPADILLTILNIDELLWQITFKKE